MKVTIEIGVPGLLQRKARVMIAPTELARVHLNVSSPEKRNRTGFYMRRHRLQEDSGKPGPNTPLRTERDVDKKPIPEHLVEMQHKGLLPPIVGPIGERAEAYYTERSMLAVPISDLVSNLLRPCFHRDGLGPFRLFHFDAEPIDRQTYWCICCFERDEPAAKCAFRDVRFDADSDRAFDVSGTDLLDEGLTWAAALVPLVVAGRPLSPVEIARRDYDLRQMLRRDNESPVRYAYEGWFDDWDRRVEKVVSDYEREGRPFETFYHSFIGLDVHGNIHIGQEESTLPDLARDLASQGITSAGILDSGGSCAIYDVWMASYLNHGWYFRENRGAVLVFELNSSQRIPQDLDGTWIYHRRKK